MSWEENIQKSVLSLPHSPRLKSKSPGFSSRCYLSIETLTNSYFLQLNDYETNRIRDDVSGWCGRVLGKHVQAIGSSQPHKNNQQVVILLRAGKIEYNDREKYPAHQSDGNISSNEVPSSQMTLKCDKK